MKMSKSFALPVETARPYNETEVRDGVGDYVLSADDSVDLEAVCVAINMHDELVGALERVLKFTEQEPLSDLEEQLRYNAFKTLQKAKS